jgi:hypothetical protein
MPKISLLPTSPNIPYRLKLVTSSVEYANESIEVLEGVSEGICVGRNEYLGGNEGGGDPGRGESGDVRVDESPYLLGTVLLVTFTHLNGRESLLILRSMGSWPGTKLAYFLPVSIDLSESCTVRSR